MSMYHSKDNCLLMTMTTTEQLMLFRFLTKVRGHNNLDSKHGEF
jgi:hypothetical protein